MQAEIMDTRESTGLVEKLTRGEVDMQVATAKRYPRSIDSFKKDLEALALLDKATAQECFYSLPRGGKLIEGPSARFAEVAASSWGNLRAEARIVDDGDKFVTAQATAWDMERNVLVRFETRRRITGSNGKRYNDDMIGTTGNAAASIAFRNAVLKVIPQAHWKPIYERCRVLAVGGEKGLSATRDQCRAWFKDQGVEDKQLLALLEKPSWEDVGVSDVITLRGIGNAIKEGESSIENIFEEYRSTLQAGSHRFGFGKAEPAKPKGKKKTETKSEWDGVGPEPMTAEEAGQ